MPRAYRVLWREEEVGLLGEGPGAFLSSVESSLPAPRLPHAHYSSLDEGREADVAALAKAARSFDELVAALERRGYALVTTAHDDAFPGGHAP